jgi:hypothetical protein
MATIKQITANRLNAQLSTGPRTPEGKSAARLNALKHGIFATDPIIPTEDPVLFEAIRTGHYDRFVPATPEEHTLVAALIRNAWLLERLSNTETDMWTATMTRNKRYEKPSNPLAEACGDLAKRLSYLQRRVDSAERHYRRDLELLLKLRKLRPAPVESAAPPPAPSQPAAPPVEPAEIGFVPAQTIERPLPTQISTPITESLAESPTIVSSYTENSEVQHE